VLQTNGLNILPTNKNMYSFCFPKIIWFVKK
jgi:hypothetical protein